MNKYKKLGVDTFLLFLGNLGSKMIIFLLLPFYTKFLSTEKYGIIDLVTSYTSLLIPIFSLLMSEAIFRLPVGKPYEEKKEYFSSCFFFGNISILVGSILIIILNKKFNINFFIDIKILILIIITTFNYTFVQQFLKTLDYVKEYSFLGVVYSLIFTILNIYLVKKDLEKGYFESIILTNIVLILIILFSLKLYKYISLKKINKKIIKEALKYSIPLLPTSIIWWIINLSDRIILKKYYSVETLGIYGVSSKFSLIISTIFSIFYSAWQISAIKEYQKEKYENFYKNIFKLIEIILTIIAILSLLFLPIVYKFFIDISYIRSLKYISILIFGTIFSNFSLFIGVNYITSKKTKMAFYTGIIAGIINLVLNIILIPKYEILGASLATLIAYILFFIIRKKSLDNVVKLEISNKYIIFYIILTIALILLSYNYSIKSIIGIIFITFIYVFINIKEIKRIIKKGKKYDINNRSQRSTWL